MIPFPQLPSRPEQLSINSKQKEDLGSINSNCINSECLFPFAGMDHQPSVLKYSLEGCLVSSAFEQKTLDMSTMLRDWINCSSLH